MCERAPDGRALPRFTSCRNACTLDEAADWITLHVPSLEPSSTATISTGTPKSTSFSLRRTLPIVRSSL